MSRKALTLIHGEEIEIAAGIQILPAEDYQSLLSAQEMLDKVREDAKKFVEKNVAEVETIKEEAEKAGFDEGLQKWADQLKKLEEEIERSHSEVQKLVIPVALRAAKKIVAQELKLDPKIIVSIVAENLKAITQHTKIKIFVSREDFSVLDSHKNELKSLFENLKSLTIIPSDDVETGGYIIESEIGIINGQLGNRWSLLERAFEKLMPAATASEASSAAAETIASTQVKEPS